MDEAGSASDENQLRKQQNQDAVPSILSLRSSSDARFYFWQGKHEYGRCRKPDLILIISYLMALAVPAIITTSDFALPT